MVDLANYLTGETLKKQITPAIELAKNALGQIIGGEELIADLNARLEGDESLNKLSAKTPNGLFTADSNKVPFHACRIAAFFYVIAQQVSHGSLTTKNSDTAESISSDLMSAMVDLVTKLGVDDPKKFATAALIVIKKQSPAGSGTATAIENLEAAHDKFVQAGNIHNQWARENKEKSKLIKAAEPARKFQLAPEVIEAAVKVIDAFKADPKIIISPVEMRFVVESFKNGFMAQVFEDMAKSLPKSQSKTSADLQNLAEQARELSNNETPAQTQTYNRLFATLIDKLSRNNAPELAAINQTFTEINARLSKLGR